MCSHDSVVVDSYSVVSPEFLEYDPKYPVVASLLIDAIRHVEPLLRVEHVGSTAVPGCGGKGCIDLLVTYPHGHLELARESVARLGYQPQQTRNPFPETRPMRVGRVAYMGRDYLVHVHIVAATSPEVDELLKFRERLCADAALRRTYEAEKRRILSEGVRDSVEYAERKGRFIRQVLTLGSPFGLADPEAQQPVVKAL